MRPAQKEMRDAIDGELPPMKCPRKMPALVASIALLLPQFALPQQLPPPPPQRSQAPPLRSISTEVSVPISTVILFDDSLKTKPQEQLQASLRAIAGGFGDKDEVALFRFDQNPQ